MSKDRFGFNKWAETYDEDVKKAAAANDWMFKDYDQILDKVVDYCDLNNNIYSTVIDIGIGTGNLSFRFLTKGLHVIGIEPSEEMREICQQKYPDITVKTGDFLNIPLPPNSADLIVSAYSFHHLTPTQKIEAIHVMKRVLKTKGRIVIADLMFQNSSQAKFIKQLLRESGRGDIVEEIKDECLGLFNDLRDSFIIEGFTFQGEQLTDSVWIFCACL